MPEQMGHITVNERVPSQRFNRFVDEKIKDWMREHALGEDSTDYEVAFFDEDSIGEVSCLVVIHSGDHLWRSWESADNPRIALRRSLERLHEEIAEVAARRDSEIPTVTH